MKITKHITRVCDDCRVVRVRGRVTLKHCGARRCTSRRAHNHNEQEQR